VPCGPLRENNYFFCSFELVSGFFHTWNLLGPGSAGWGRSIDGPDQRDFPSARKHPVLAENPFTFDLVTEDETVGTPSRSSAMYNRGLEKLVEKKDFLEYT